MNLFQSPSGFVEQMIRVDRSQKLANIIQQRVLFFLNFNIQGVVSRVRLAEQIPILEVNSWSKIAVAAGRGKLHLGVSRSPRVAVTLLSRGSHGDAASEGRRGQVLHISLQPGGSVRHAGASCTMRRRLMSLVNYKKIYIHKNKPDNNNK